MSVSRTSRLSLPATGIKDRDLFRAGEWFMKAPFRTILQARREPRLGASRLNLRNPTLGAKKVKFSRRYSFIKFQTLKRMILHFVTDFLTFWIDDSIETLSKCPSSNSPTF